MIRKATPKDTGAILDLAVESVSNNPIPVRISKTAMQDTIEFGYGNDQFLWVSEVDGVVVGAVGAMCSPSFWFERQQCSVMLYYSRVPGEGAKLIRELMRWVKARPTIKVCVMELEPETDPRMIKFLNRLGMTRQSMNVSYVRGMS